MSEEKKINRDKFDLKPGDIEWTKPPSSVKGDDKVKKVRRIIAKMRLRKSKK